MDPEARRSFSVWDFVVFGLSLFFSCAIGLVIALRKSKSRHGSNTDFLMGGRSMPLLPTALSLMSSVVSGISLLSYPAEVYTLGSAFFWSVLGNILALAFTAVFIIPVIYQVKTFSLYYYLQIRFDFWPLRSYGALLFTLATLLYMAIVLYAPSVALAAVTSVDVWVFIVSVGIVCTLYTSVGGLRAVVWTDSFQTIVMYAGSITLVIKGCIDAGGIKKVYTTAKSYGRFDGWTNTDPNPFQYMTVWTALFGGFFYWLGTWGSNQMSLQRYCSTSSVNQARLLAVITIPFVVLINLLVYTTGLVMFTNFFDCDPLKTDAVETKDQLSILFMMDVLQDVPGLPGLFIACLFSGTLSTVSSGINSLAAVFLDEFIKPIRSFYVNIYLKSSDRHKDHEKFDMWIVKIIGVVFGLIAIGLAFLAQKMGGILIALTSGLGALSGPLTGLILLGVLVPFANWKGALIGTLVGNILALWVFIGSQVTKPTRPQLPTFTYGCNATSELFTTTPHPYLFESQAYKTEFDYPAERFYYLSYYMFSVLSTVSTILVGITVSLVTGGRQCTTNNPELCFWTMTKQRINLVGGNEETVKQMTAF